MRKSRLSSAKQSKLIEHFVAGTTARYAADLIEVNRNTAAYYFQRLREIIVDQLKLAFHEVFAGEIEVDESYIGGTRQDKRGRGAAGKVPVFGLFLKECECRSNNPTPQAQLIQLKQWVKQYMG